MVNASEFAKRLQKVLDYYGVSATAFSEEIDFNRSTISHLLSGRNKPSLEFVMKVLEKYPEIELYWLLNGKGSFPSKENMKAPATTEKRSDQILETQTLLPKKKLKEKDNAIDKIVIFYKDGTFRAYEND